MSYVTDVITSFKLDPATGKSRRECRLSAAEPGYAPSSHSKDVTISSDGKHVLAGIIRAELVSMAEPETAATYKGQYTLAATKPAVGKPGVYDLAGIAEYDLN